MVEREVKDMMEMYKITYDEILIARLEIHIKNMWSKDKSSVSISLIKWGK